MQPLAEATAGTVIGSGYVNASSPEHFTARSDYAWLGQNSAAPYLAG